MTRTERPLDNPINWSFRVGQLFDIEIRIHIAFVICALVLLSMEFRSHDAASAIPFWRTLLNSMGTYALLFFIVLVHELGHCFGARSTGGEADEILIWPLGGLATTNPPHNARAHMITTVAGPMVNVVFCSLAAIVLILWTGTIGAVPLNPVHPFVPLDSSLYWKMSETQLWVVRFYGISYLLLLFNLLPIFPFDGGRIVQAWLWPRKGYQSSMQIATTTGMIGAILVGVFSLFIENSWLLLMIAVFGYMTCWKLRRHLKETADFGGEFGYDFSKGYSAFEDSPPETKRPGYFERRRLRKETEASLRRQQRLETLEIQVEAILRKIAQHGMDSLSPQERKLLEEESQRKRMDS